LKKLTGQARLFSEADLKHIYHRLLEIDLAEKRSDMPLEVGLDSFLASIASAR